MKLSLNIFIKKIMANEAKVKAAMEQIKKIIDENDLGCLIVLQSPTYSQHHLKINPSHSVIQITNAGKLELKSEVLVMTDKKARDKKEGTTSEMLKALGEISSKLSAELLKVFKLTDALLKADKSKR